MGVTRFYPDQTILGLFSPVDVEHPQLRTLIRIGKEIIDSLQVVYLEASGGYTFIHFEDKPKIVLAITLSKMTAQLPYMLRLHKSYSINVCKINRTKRARKGKGVLTITLHNGTQFGVSRRRDNEVTDALTPHNIDKRSKRRLIKQL